MPAHVARNWALAGLLLIVCAAYGLAQGSGAGEHMQLVVWHDDPHDQQVLRPVHDLIWIYQQHDPQVLIHLTVKPTADAYQQLKGWTGADAVNAPDMTIVPARWLEELGSAFRSTGHLLPPDRRQSFYAPVLDMFAGDRQRAVPWSIAARCLLVRSDILKEHSLEPPTTWEEVDHVAIQLHSPPDLYGFGLPGTDGEGQLFAEALWALGGKLTDESGTVRLDTDPAVGALELYCELARSSQPEVLSWSQSEIEELFGEGRVAMIISDSWVARSLARRVPELQFEVCPLPGQEQPVSHLLGEGLVIFRNTQHMDRCIRFARMICGDDCQERLLALGGIATSRPVAERHRSDPLIGPLMAGLEQARVLKASYYGSLQEILAPALYAALSGRATPAQALRGAPQSLTTASESP